VTKSSPSEPAPSIDFLREVAAQQGVSPTDDDLEGVLGFLEVVLPQLEELERRIPPETPA
jgi:hypothetical protein